ncbi:hypothetical protein [Vibrio vulnificus YJ016]|uniref:Uncharacterized protein n=1 Tax=Vibrio vulnificus (strain YJ016) TaxID=196600 RepID=Q7MDL9_VIBVY|nr:hypothetical protein [Vibrio vulnificus YJ016]
MSNKNGEGDKWTCLQTIVQKINLRSLHRAFAYVSHGKFCWWMMMNKCIKSLD